MYAKYIVLFLLVSLNSNASLFWGKLEQLGALSDNVYKVTSNVGKIIDRPASAWVNVLVFKENLNFWCLNYKVSSKDKLGVLKLSLRNKKCIDEFFITKKAYLYSGIQDLKVTLKNKKMNLFYKLAGKDMTRSIDLQSYDEDLIFFDQFVEKTINSSDACHDFEKNCNETIAFECQRCRNGWSYGATSLCPSKRTKYCNENRCGAPNEKACSRGMQFQEIKALFGCQNDSLSAICSQESKIICVAQQLYCR